MRKNSPDQAETIELFLSKDKTPIAYRKKVAELVKCGMSNDEAENFVSTTPFEMEFYYSDDLGLFLVESEAVEYANIVDPYTGEELLDYDIDEERDAELIENFIDIFGTKCEDGEDLAHVELMMDNHFCIRWGNDEYYIPENNSLFTEEDELIQSFLFENCKL